MNDNNLINIDFLHEDRNKTKPIFYKIFRVNDVKIINRVAERFKPYFYIDNDEIIPQEMYNTIFEVQSGYKSIFGVDVKKIVCNELSQDSFLRLRDYFKKTYEDDILFRLRYIIDNDTKFDKNQRIIYFDIETNLSTDVINTPEPIISIALYDNFLKKYFVFVWHKDLNFNYIETENKNIFYFNDEKLMLSKFFNTMKELNPDILSGWFINGFDLPYLINRSKLLNLRNEINFLSPYHIINNHTNSLVYSIIKKDNKILDKDMIYTRIYGVEILDLIKIYKKLTYDNKPDNYRLNTVAKHLLGQEKIKADNISKIWNENINLLTEYNLNDVRLCVDIDRVARLTEYMLSVQQLVPMPLESVFYNSRVVDCLILKKYHNKVIFPSKRKHQKEFAMGAFAGHLEIINEKQRINEILTLNEPFLKLNDEFWYANAPAPGLYKNICVFDFKALYSNIYRTFNLSPETIDENGDLQVNNVKINTKVKGVIPQLFEDLLNERKKIEEMRDKLTDRNSVEYYALQNLQGGVKTIANSITGVANYPSFRLYNPQISRLVMWVARYLLVIINKYLNTLNYNTLMSDTDSFFVQLNTDNAKDEAEKLKENINKYLKDSGYKYLEVDCEKIFNKVILFDVKKRYVGKLIYEKGNKVDKIFRRGGELVRKDTPQIFKNIMLEIVNMLLEENIAVNKINLFIKSKIAEVMNLNNWDLGITKQINKSLEEYTVLSQHIRAAKYSNKILGTAFGRSDSAKMLFIKGAEEDVILVDEDTKLPSNIKIDYERFFDFFIYNKLRDFCVINEFRSLQYINNKNEILDRWI